MKHHECDVPYLRRLSPPTRGRGLKPVVGGADENAAVVAPHAGAWIETNLADRLPEFRARRPPRGGVD